METTTKTDGAGKKACFIGHRNAPDTDELRNMISETVRRLIIENGVVYFLFGSRSNFDWLCHGAATELQKTYPDIRRIAYTCCHESVTMKEDKAEEERSWSKLLKHPVHIRDYDREYEYPAKYLSGRASYVERNQAMINDSDFCIFYFDEHYLPPRRRYGKRYLSD